MLKHWRVKYRTKTTEIYGTINEASTKIRSLAEEAGDDPEYLGTLGADSSYRGFCFFQTYDLVSTGATPDQKGVGEIEEQIKYATDPKPESAMKARFYIYNPAEERYTQVVLKPEEEHIVSGGGKTEEGCNYWSEVYRHEGNRLTRETSSSSRDCDGPSSSEQSFYCPLDKLETQECYEFEKYQIRLPDWTEMSSHQRDYYAEMDGY